VKLSHLVAANAFVFLAGGIAFALYGPLMIAMFGVLDTGGDARIYWFVASFARMYGAALFGFGFLLWALRPVVESGALSAQAKRGIILALLLGNLLALYVAYTQQASIWGTLAGWLAMGIYALLSFGYIVFLAVK
jgi:hypothetical protein